MADLEDRLLKKNIPGKYSWWDEYNDDDTDGREEEEELDEDLEEDSFEKKKKTPTAPDYDASLHPSSGIAGKRGVVADYKLHQEEVKRRACIDELEKLEIMDRNTLGAKLKPGQVSISLAATSAAAAITKQYQNDDEDDDDDDEFMAQYRQRRLQELRIAAAPKEYEGVEEVTPEQYSRAIDNTNGFLVVHIYETYIPACRTLISQLETLSRHEQLRQVRFVSLRASSAMATTIDPVALPSVLIYRKGTLVRNMTPVTEDLPERFRIDHVLELLVSCTTTANSSTSADVVATTNNAARIPSRIVPEHSY